MLNWYFYIYNIALWYFVHCNWGQSEHAISTLIFINRALQHEVKPVTSTLETTYGWNPLYCVSRFVRINMKLIYWLDVLLYSIFKKALCLTLKAQNISRFPQRICVISVSLHFWMGHWIRLQPLTCSEMCLNIWYILFFESVNLCCSKLKCIGNVRLKVQTVNFNFRV